MTEEIKVPEIGENVEAGEVVSVPVSAGDQVAVDDVIIELETDKATVEIPSPFAGKLEEVLVKEGDTVKVGDVIARIATGDDGADENKKENATDEDPPQEKTAETEAATAEDSGPEPEQEMKQEASADEDDQERQAKKKDRGEGTDDMTEQSDQDLDSFAGIPASPSVRRLARELGVDLRKVQGSAPGGRISESDVKAFTQNSGSPQPGQLETSAAQSPDLPDFGQWGETEPVELSKIRRLTAESTSTSWREIPHVTQFDQADITALQEFIEKNAENVRQTGGKLTVTAILAKVCCEALKKFPHFNASIDPANQRLILKKYVNLGVMVATDRGLLVPVVHHADQMTIAELSAAIVDLADRARSKKIKPDEMQGGSFSISNQGGIGGTAFTPIVLWPQVAILGVSRASTLPVYRAGEVQPRDILPLSLSYDHRVVDGADAARFLRWICEGLEQAFNLFLD